MATPKYEFPPPGAATPSTCRAPSPSTSIWSSTPRRTSGCAAPRSTHDTTRRPLAAAPPRRRAAATTSTARSAAAAHKHESPWRGCCLCQMRQELVSVEPFTVALMWLPVAAASWTAELLGLSTAPTAPPLDSATVYFREVSTIELTAVHHVDESPPRRHRTVRNGHVSRAHRTAQYVTRVPCRPDMAGGRGAAGARRVGARQLPKDGSRQGAAAAAAHAEEPRRRRGGRRRR